MPSLASDAKVSLDSNALYEHPDYEQYDATQPRDEREIDAHAKGLQYVGLEGSVGVIANGAGLAMSTVDVIKIPSTTPITPVKPNPSVAKPATSVASPLDSTAAPKPSDAAIINTTSRSIARWNSRSMSLSAWTSSRSTPVSNAAATVRISITA